MAEYSPLSWWVELKGPISYPLAPLAYLSVWNEFVCSSVLRVDWTDQLFEFVGVSDEVLEVVRSGH